MGSVAARGLLNLRIHRQAVSNQRRAQRRAVIGRVAEPVDVDGRGRAARRPHHRVVERNGVAQRGERTEDAVASDHRDLYMLAARKPDHQ